MWLYEERTNKVLYGGRADGEETRGDYNWIERVFDRIGYLSHYRDQPYYRTTPSDQPGHPPLLPDLNFTSPARSANPSKPSLQSAPDHAVFIMIQRCIDCGRRSLTPKSPK